VDGAVVILAHSNFTRNHVLNHMHVKGVAMLTQEE
jgi:hypothetical protein